MFNLSSLSIIGAIAAAAVVYHLTTNQVAKIEGRSEGRQEERARVETEGRKIDAKASKARAAVAATPAQRVLDPWYRD
jgi:hypothetical protein